MYSGIDYMYVPYDVCLSCKRVHCDETDWVIFTGAQLTQRGKDWWDLLRQELGSDRLKEMTWEEFKERFMKRFCPRTATDRIHEELL